jgi:UDP-N-acetyl-D-glucosamine dehydrogenase
VGGVTPACTELATAIYGRLVEEVVPVSSPRVAEAAKLLENTFRSVNIALVNELAIVCRHLGVDVWEVIAAAATKPFGFMPHYPGPGIGGHCIPLDPHYLSWKARLHGYEPRFISLASEINGGMPRYVVDLVTEALNERSRCVRGSRVLLLGVAYKPNVGDVRESPALEIARLLHERGARVSFCDPFVASLAAGELLLAAQELTPELVRESDCVVVVTHHAGFDYGMVGREAPLVIDTRNAMREHNQRDNVRFL